MINQKNIHFQNGQTKLSAEENMKLNLMVQVDKLRKHCRQNSIKTRRRYYQATERFCEFLAEVYHLQKFSNIKPRHLVHYAEYMKERGYSPAMVRTDLSAIRFFCNLAGNKNQLPDNRMLNLEKRTVGTIDRAWTEREIALAVVVAAEMGREDVVAFLKMGSIFGMRIEEASVSEMGHHKEALYTRELYIRGKNGQIRYLKLFDEQIELAKQLVVLCQKQRKRSSDKILVDPVRGAVNKEISSISSWIHNHREKFQDNTRETIKALEEEKRRAKLLGIKLNTDTLTAHGLRYYFAQKRFQQLVESGYSVNYAQVAVSESLGHHRKEVTMLYLSQNQKEGIQNEKNRVHGNQ